MNKKGQAALEFLFTYGWIFMIILVSIGALSYFGFLSFQRFVPEKCEFSYGVGCEDYKIALAGSDLNVVIKAKNNFNNDIIMAKPVKVVVRDQSADCTEPSITSPILEGDPFDINCTIKNTEAIQGEKVDAVVAINFSGYSSKTGAYPNKHSVKGTLFASVQ